jgi:hypothetical protein
VEQRSVVRIVYWLTLGCLALLSVSPNPIIQNTRPGYFIEYRDDWTMLLLGVLVLVVLVGIGLLI